MIDEARRRAKADPSDDAQLALAEILLRHAEVRRSLGETANIRQVETIASDLTRIPTRANSASDRRLASLMLDLSRWHLGSLPWGRASEWASLALRIAREEREPGTLIARACLALARADRELARESDAVHLAVEAVQRLESRIGPGPGRLEDRLSLADARFEAGRLLARVGDRPEAIALLQSSINLRLQLDRDFPLVHATRAELGEARRTLARVFQSEGRIGQALANRLQATLDLTRAVALAPGEPTYRVTLRQIARETFGFSSR